VIVSAYVPAGVDEPVLTFMVVEPLPVTAVGVKLALAPLGSPDTLKVTAPLKPFSVVVATL
jgi:hypothetical protein